MSVRHLLAVLCAGALLAGCAPRDLLPAARQAARASAAPVVAFAGDGRVLHGAIAHDGLRVRVEGRPLDGGVLERDGAGRWIALRPYRDGFTDGIVCEWHPSGSLAWERAYRRGEKHGVQAGYWDGGAPQSRYTARHDQVDGARIEWFSDGRVARECHYRDGREDGAQRAWYEDGRLRANYVVRDGRRFGLMGEKPCTSAARREGGST